MVNGLANNAEIDDSSNCDATVVLLKKGNRRACVQGAGAEGPAWPPPPGAGLQMPPGGTEVPALPPFNYAMGPSHTW